MSGTGGNFLANFITMAKLNSKEPLQLSKHGNAHNSIWVELSGSKSGPYSPGQPASSTDEEKIKHLLSGTPVKNSVPIYYPFDHIIDLKLCTMFFEKAIRITYEKDDINDVIYSYVGKYHIDTARKNANDIFNLKLVSQVHISNYLKHFSTTDKIPNVLYISWRELVYDDPIILIEKLNNFTKIPNENFSIENLIKWRKATHSCIDTFASAKYSTGDT